MLDDGIGILTLTIINSCSPPVIVHGGGLHDGTREVATHKRSREEVVVPSPFGDVVQGDVARGIARECIAARAREQRAESQFEFLHGPGVRSRVRKKRERRHDRSLVPARLEAARWEAVFARGGPRVIKRSETALKPCQSRVMG